MSSGPQSICDHGIQYLTDICPRCEEETRRKKKRRSPAGPEYSPEGYPYKQKPLAKEAKRRLRAQESAARKAGARLRELERTVAPSVTLPRADLEVVREALDAIAPYLPEGNEGPAWKFSAHFLAAEGARAALALLDRALGDKP